MLNLINDDLRLVGLIILTKPFDYQNNNVTADISSYVEIESVRALRNQLNQEKENLPPEIASDEHIREYTDEIYFLDTIIQTLESK
jgi:hypothetical protein